MDSNLFVSADAIGMFCRLHMRSKKELPIRSSEMGVLIYVNKQEAPVTPLMISNFFKITKPSVTHMVHSLIAGDYLVKEPSLTDGRSYQVKISAKGKKLVETTLKEYLKNVELLRNQMGHEDFDHFVELVHKANQILGDR